MRVPKWVQRTAIALALVVVSVMALYAFLQTGPGRTLAISLIESAVSSENLTLSIDGLGGTPPHAPHVKKLTIGDAKGPWLILDDVRVEWRPLAYLFGGGLVIDDVTATRIDWLREPIASEANSDGDGGLPSLAIRNLAIATLSIAQDVAGAEGQFAVAGSADLLDTNDRADVKLKVLESKTGGARAEIDAQYSAAESRLDLKAAVEDRAGGTLASMLGLPGDAPLTVRLESKGSLDNWAAELTASGGSELSAQGRATIVRAGAWRDLVLTLTSNIGSIGPERLRSLYQGRSTVDLKAARSDAGALRIDQLNAVTPVLQVEGAGAFDAGAKRAEGNVTATIPNGKAVAPLIDAAADWHDLVVTAKLRGAWPTPTLTVDVRALDVTAQDVSSAVVSGRLEATPDRRWDDDNARIAILANVEAADVAAADATLGGLLGSALKLALQATVVEREKLTGIAGELATAAMTLRFAGDASDEEVKGAVSLDAPDLVRAGLMGGALSLRTNIDANPARDTWRLEGKGEAQDVATGEVVDGLLAGKQKLAFTVSGIGSRLSVPSIVLGGDHLSLIASGTAGPGVLNFDGRLVVPELGVMSPEHGGKAEVELHVGGAADRPQVSGTAKLSNGKLASRATKSLALTLAKPDANGLSRLSLGGDYDGKPVEGSANVAWQTQGGVRIDDLRLGFASVSLAGNALVGADNLVTGRFEAAVRQLADIAPFVDEDISGSLSGSLRFDAADGSQTLSLDLAGPQFRIDTATLTAPKLDGAIDNLFGAAAFSAHLKAATADIDGFELQALDTAGQGPLRALAISATAAQGDTRIKARATLKLEGKPSVISVEALELSREGKTAKLAAPTDITIGEHHVLIANARIAAGGGSVVLSGDAGRATDLSVTASNLPLWAATFVTEPLPATGTVSGTARIREHGATTFDVKIARLAPADEPGLIRNLTLAATGQTDRNATDFKLTLADAGRTSFKASGRVPFAESAVLKIDAEGTADLALANVYLGVTGDRARGKLTASAELSGTRAAPRIEGTGKITDGYFRSAESGFELKDIAAAFDGSERRIAVTSLTAKAPNGGTISGRGEIRLDPAAGYPLDLALTAKNAQFVSTELTTVVADIDARMSGGLLRRPVIAGTADIDLWEIRLPDKLARPLNPIRVTHRNAPPEVVARLLPEEEEAQSTLQLGLDVTVRAPRRVFVRGQGVDAEFGGQVKVAGTVDDPSANGKFELRRGAVSVLNQRVSLTQGDITFAGDIVPTLDIAGTISKTDLTATVAVKGKATSPEITLSSSPTLPQDEIIARILFNKSVQQLSAFEAAQLAVAVARWSGLSTGPDILESLRSALGIDALSAVTDAAGGTAVSAGTYVGSGVYVGFVQGADAAAGRATVDIDLTERIKLRGEVAPSGDNRVGVVAEWEY